MLGKSTVPQCGLATPTSDAHRVRIAVAYAALVPITVIPLGSARVGAADLLFPVAAVAATSSSRERMRGPTVWLAVFIAASFAATYCILWMHPGLTSPFLIVRMYGIVLPFLLVSRISHLGWRDFNRIVKAFILSGWLSCAVGIVLYQAGIQVRDAQQVNWYGNGHGSSLRAGGLWGNSGDFGHLAALLATAALVLAALDTGISRLLLASVFTTGLYAIFISTSRAATLHLVVTLLVALPLVLSQRTVRYLAAVIIGVGLGGFVAWKVAALGYQDIFALRRFDFLNVTGNSTFYASNTRFDSWAASLRLMIDHPFLGIGYDMKYQITGHAGDNSFLTLGAEAGVVAGFAYLMWWAAIVWTLARQNERRLRFVGL